MSRAATGPRLPALVLAAGLAPLAVLLPHVGSDVARGAAEQTGQAGRYEMPFPCAEEWTGATRSRHSPSPRSIDWNRPDDDGDPVVASAPGTVVVADDGGSGYGRWVRVDHGEGRSTIYAHLSSVAVEVGQSVDQGMLLGAVGSTGNSTGPHLHYEQRSGSAVVQPWFHGAEFVFGSTLASQNCVDVPTSGNFVAGPEDEPVVFRRARPSTFEVLRPGREPKVIKFGKVTDQPVVGDWNGDGRSDPGAWSPGSATFRLRSPEGRQDVVLGASYDAPVAGDWDGDGRWEVGVRRPSTGQFQLRHADGTLSTVALGDADDVPVTGDWEGDGVTDLGVYDLATATFTLRRVDAEGVVWTAQVQFGRPGDLPVTGDWNGDARTDLGVWAPATATFSQRRAASATDARARARVTQVRFGHPR